MKFSQLCQYFQKLETTPSRLAMTEILADMFRTASHTEIAIVVNLSLGQLQPKFNRLEFNLADKMVLRAIAAAYNLPIDQVVTAYKSVGDIGNLVIKLKPSVSTHSDQDIKAVYQSLLHLAQDNGQGSQERKTHYLSNLLQTLDPISAKYISRMVIGKLRLGFSDMTILDALSWMEAGDKSRRKILENAYQLTPDVGELARLVKKLGSHQLDEHIEVKIGVPVIPALAQRLKTAQEMINKMGKVAVEAKYDGTRVQIHFVRNNPKSNPPTSTSFVADTLFETPAPTLEVRTFTRNLDETTHMFPEIQQLADLVTADELILDSEAVGIDPQTGKMMAFQDTIKRKRKHGITKAATDIPLCFFVFDVLYKDGQSLVKMPYHERRRILEQVFSKGLANTPIKARHLIELPEVLVTEDPEELRAFHAEKLKLGLEGALVKKWDGIYEPGRRGWSWVKFKESEGSAAKLSDTIDALVMGLYGGKGKRTQFGVGAFLIGIRSEVTTPHFVEGNFYTISKVGTGLTDDKWRELKSRAKPLETNQQPPSYTSDKNLYPDTWLSPGLVVEIAADEITKSPIHTAGVALRFPRLIRFRDDKHADQVTSITELEQIV